MVNIPNATELDALTWLLVYYENFNSIFKNHLWKIASLREALHLRNGFVVLNNFMESYKHFLMF